jgi:DMSO/TMAO reductase YedYZ molybdopterin-dependent catalytic subunit
MKNPERDIFEQRRKLLGGLGALGIAAFTLPSLGRAAESNVVELPFANGERPLSSAFPQKRDVIVQRARPPLLETPWDVFDKGVFTPNDRFYVRWHLPSIPSSIDPQAFRLAIHGQVNKTVQPDAERSREEVSALRNRCGEPMFGQFPWLL